MCAAFATAVARRPSARRDPHPPPGLTVTQPPPPSRYRADAPAAASPGPRWWAPRSNPSTSTSSPTSRRTSSVRSSSIRSASSAAPSPPSARSRRVHRASDRRGAVRAHGRPLGRRATLLWTVGIMGVATGAIGLLPTYAQAGWLGAVLLVLLRIAQGLSLGGEWGGSILLATEHSGPVKRAFYASIPQLGSPVGSILSAAVFIVMTSHCPQRSSRRGDGASRSCSPSRSSPSRSTSAGRSPRRRCSRRSSPRTAATACRSSRCSRAAPARSSSPSARPCSASARTRS